MKKIMLAATVALCFAGSSIAETAGGDTASGFASGKLDKEMIAGGAAAALVILGMNSNNRGTLAPIVVKPPIDCGAGEELVDGVCVPVTTTTPVTTTVTTTNTVNSTITTPVTVSTTSL